MVHSCQCFAQRRFGGHQQRGQTLDAETGMAPVLLERGKYRKSFKPKGSGLILAQKKKQYLIWPAGWVLNLLLET